MPTSTVEDYLKCIYLEEEAVPGGLVGMGRVGSALGVAPGTVTAMVKTLADSGLVRYEPYSGVRLTEAGRQLALHVLRRHRLVELFLVEVLGMDWSEVHREAESLEHAVSDRVIERIDVMLGRPAVDPHGDPIPDARGELREQTLASLIDCPVATRLAVARITDQSPAFLQLVERRGLMPGSAVEVARRHEAADTVALRLAGGETMELGFRAASKILVAAPVASAPPASPTPAAAAAPAGARRR
ncbi:MAG TPA: metal-dependent transcriptional regulator [Thermoanaerobaculia bacterium]|nr:metal-dependent transcriptional regulator [Thermoanaerobaculia bacterium]